MGGGGAFRNGGAGLGLARPGGGMAPGANFSRPGFPRPNAGAVAGNFDNRGQWAAGGQRWRGGHWRGGRWGGGGWWPGYGAAAVGLGYGVGAWGYPYDGGYYGYDDYPAYSTVITGALGDYCATPVKTCRLYEPADVGASCSCKVGGGRAGGFVQ